MSLMNVINALSHFVVSSIWIVVWVKQLSYNNFQAQIFSNGR